MHVRAGAADLLGQGLGIEGQPAARGEVAERERPDPRQAEREDRRQPVLADHPGVNASRMDAEPRREQLTQPPGVERGARAEDVHAARRPRAREELRHDVDGV